MATMTVRDYFRERAHAFIDEYVHYLSENDMCQYADASRDYDRMVESLTNTFADWHIEDDSQRGEARAVFAAVLASHGGLVYVPDIDGAPCVTTADKLRTMTQGAATWQDAIQQHGAKRL